MNILRPTSPFGAIESVCTELGLSHTTYTIIHNDIPIIIYTLNDDSATVWMNEHDNTIVFVLSDSIYIVRKDHYLQLRDGPEGQTLYFGPILRGTMGLDLSWCDNHVSEIEDLLRALELAKLGHDGRDWHAIAWGNDHMPTTKLHQKRIETTIGRSIDADVQFDEEGHVIASVVLKLTVAEVQKLRELYFIWHVEPVPKPKPSQIGGRNNVKSIEK